MVWPCRVILQAFITCLDLDYQGIYPCQLCSPDNMTIIIDGKEMGIRHTLSKPYERPLDTNAAVVPIDW